jgi:DNA-binding PadR family transcriptional regulator
VRILSITSDLIRGHTDTIILAALMNGDNYGYKINRMIFEMTSGSYELKEATLYTSFKRLEEEGCISSYWGDEATGARRRYYTITNHGKKVYERLVDEWNETKALVDKLISK